jgi:ribosome recycling factor
MMKEKVKKVLEEERVQDEKLRKEQFDYLVQEMHRYQASTEEKVQEMEEKIEKLEDRVQQKIKEEVKRI